MLEERHEIIEFSPNVPLKIFMHKLGFVGKHWHQSLELLMVLEGSIEITVNGRSCLLHSEDIILINSNSIHEIHSESAVMIALQIDLTRIHPFDKAFEDIAFDCNSTAASDPTLFEGIRFAIATMVRDNTYRAPDSDYRNYSLTYLLISELIRYFQIPVTDEIKNQQKYISRLTRIVNYIQEHYAENFSLSDLAETEQLSVPYLSSFFDRHMGIKFSQYYTNVKLSHAVSELVSTKDSIESIALRNGFTESHSFVRCFKKRYGMLPSAYRKEQKNAAGQTQDNLNYLKIEPSSYLHLLTKYLGNRDTDYYRLKKDYTDELTIPDISTASSFRKLTHTFKRFTAVSRAKELLNTNIQNMLKDLQSNIGYEYIKFHGILSDDMMVVSRTGGRLLFHYTLVDMVLDFLISIDLKPLIQFSFMPRDLASDRNKTIFHSPFNTSPPKEMSEWEMLITDFTEHIIKRYGISTVRTWLFCVWNEPTTPKSMFGFGNDSLFFEFYKRTYRTVKEVCPDLVFGSPSILYMENLGSVEWISAFISYARKHQCVPEFINVHYYSDIIPSVDNQNFYIAHSASSSFPKRTDDFSLWVGSIRKIMATLKLSSVPIYLTEWNFTLSHRNLVNDTCFKSCYILKNLLQNYDRLDSFGYWCVTDLLEENELPDILFHGGLGIYTMNGLRKNVFYSFYFANMLGDELIAAGNGYFVTKKDQSCQIITYNYVHYGNLFASGELFDITETNRYTAFDMSKKIQINLTLTDLENGRYEIREYFVNRQYGSAFDLWLKMGAVPLDPHDTDLLRGLCVPGYHKEYRLVEKNTAAYSALLKPLEIRFAEIKKL